MDIIPTNLNARRLTTPKMIISDGHQGIKADVKTEFMGTNWQRCVVLFLRNIISKIARKNNKQEGDKLKEYLKLRQNNMRSNIVMIFSN